MHKTFRFFIVLSICLFLFLTACSDSTDSVDGDIDNIDGDTEMDGDYVEKDLEMPEEQPKPDGVADIQYLFNQENLSLKDWRVRDKSELPLGIGSSDWTVINRGLVQWSDLEMTNESEPESDTSDFLSSEIRNELQPVNPSAIELEFSVGNISGGIGLSFGSGNEQIILCLDETLCGSKFVRYKSDGKTKAVQEIDTSFSNDKHKMLLTISDGWLMLSLDDELLLTTQFTTDATGTVGVLNYMMQNLTIHSLSIWGDVKGKNPRPASDWSVIAHRGHGNSRTSNALPENTIEACMQGHNDGADFLEVDVLLSKDDIPVLMHDTSLNRTTDCTGAVKDKTLAELEACQIDDDSSYDGEPIFVQTLEDAIKEVAGAGWFIELKSTDEAGNIKLAEAVVAIMQQYSIDSDSYIISFELDMLKQVKLVDSKIKTAWVGSYFDETRIAEAKNEGMDALDVAYVSADADMISAVHEAGLKLYIWTADNQSEFEKYIEMGVDGITTNATDRLNATAYEK